MAWLSNHQIDPSFGKICPSHPPPLHQSRLPHKLLDRDLTSWQTLAPVYTSLKLLADAVEGPLT